MEMVRQAPYNVNGQLCCVGKVGGEEVGTLHDASSFNFGNV